jgi:hypothetical protein
MIRNPAPSSILFRLTQEVRHHFNSNRTLYAHPACSENGSAHSSAEIDKDIAPVQFYFT